MSSHPKPQGCQNAASKYSHPIGVELLSCRSSNSIHAIALPMSNLWIGDGSCGVLGIDSVGRLLSKDIFVMLPDLDPREVPRKCLLVPSSSSSAHVPTFDGLSGNEALKLLRRLLLLE